MGKSRTDALEHSAVARKRGKRARIVRTRMLSTRSRSLLLSLFPGRRAPVYFILLSILCLTFPASAGQTQSGFDAEEAIDRIATEQLQKQKIPAMTIAVGLDGRVVYSRGFGSADLENGVPATAETLIRTGSIAKPLSAVAVLTWVEAGKLELDAPVQKYCPTFPRKPWEITTRELLMHTSGIRHYKDDEIANTRHYETMSDGFAIFANDPLLFEPGTKFSYSTYGYTVVGCVLEGASGEKFFNYLREHVLQPAGMTHTFVDSVSTIVLHRARGYQVKNGNVENAGLMDSSYKIPGGGLVSTAEDIVRFDLALMDGKILKPATLAAMWTPSDRPQLQGGKPSTYGMGFDVLTTAGQKYVTHNGGQQGTSTAMAFIPSKRFAVAVFTNDENGRPDDVLRPILDLYHMPHP
ncbi:MAG TPA: serine hydrolase domain-containing protein [Terriglobales bacterium]|nr:serine hydrolase domain-containing protein [Terriglobales bacterium]